MANFTPQEIERFLQEFFDVVGTRQYIGARYVPLFGRRGEDSIAWDNSAPYEPLTIVLYQGSSYTSRTYVPAGIDVSDTAYWARTGDYDAQVEQYRALVDTYIDRTHAIEYALPIGDFDSENTVKDYIDRSQDLSQYSAIIYSDSTFVENTNVPGEGYTGVLGTMIAQRTGMTIDNRGVSGTSLSDLITYLEAADQTQFVGYDYVFVAYSTNDWQGNTAIWRRGADNDIYTFEWRLNRVCDLLETLAPQCQVVFVTPAYGSRDYENQEQRNYNQRAFTLESYANVILMVCRQRRIACIDLWHTMNVNESNKSVWMVRSSYDPQHQYYNIWVHYSKRLKERIADLFYYAYPYNIPADPYDIGEPLQFEPSNISWAAPHTVFKTPMVSNLFFNSIGSKDSPHSQPLLNFYAVGDFTFSCQPTEPCFVQFIDSVGTVKRFTLYDELYVANLHVSGMYGKIDVYAVDHRWGESTEGQKKTELHNVRITAGNTKWVPTSQATIPSKPTKKLTSPKLGPSNVNRNECCTYTIRDGCVFVDITYQIVTEQIGGGETILTVPASPFANLNANQSYPSIFVIGVVFISGVWTPTVFTVQPANNMNVFEVKAYNMVLAVGTYIDLHFSVPMFTYGALA